MKNNLLKLCCIALLICCVILSSVIVFGGNATEAPENPGQTQALPAGTGSDDIQFKLALLHIYSESERLVTTLPYTTIQISHGALLKAFMSSPASATDAHAFIDNYYDRTIDSAFTAMDEILAKYSSLLKRYNIASTSSYNTDYSKLSSMFASLKNSSTELITRTRTLINKSDSDDYDDYYTLYIEQVSDLSSKIESYNSTLMDKYDTLLSSISNDYDIIK